MPPGSSHSGHRCASALTSGSCRRRGGNASGCSLRAGDRYALAVVSIAFCVQAARWVRARAGGRSGAARFPPCRRRRHCPEHAHPVAGRRLVFSSDAARLGHRHGRTTGARGRRSSHSGAMALRRSVVALSVVIACLIGNARAFSSLEHQPMRSAAGRLGLHIGSAHTAAVGVSDRQMLLYDPRVAIIHTVAELEKAEQAAAAAGLPLVISLCGWDESPPRARSHGPPACR